MLAFQALAYRYIYYRTALGRLNPKWYSCPIECPESKTKPFDANRQKFCDDCRLGQAKNRFKEKTLELWKTRLGAGDAARFRFETILKILEDIIAGENKPDDKISVKTEILLNAYLHEKNKAQAVEEYKNKKD